MGPEAIARTFLGQAGLDALLIDTGYRSDELFDPAKMAVLSGAPASEVVRLEAVAETVACSGIDAHRFRARTGTPWTTAPGTPSG